MEIEKHRLNLDTILEILGNPTRRAILMKLAKLPQSGSELAHALDISRQAVHSQLKILSDNNIIDEIESGLKGSKLYRIKENLSISIDIFPDYFNIQYSSAQINNLEPVQLKDVGCSVDYENLKEPNEKIKYLGEKITNLEENLQKIDEKRNELIQNKECLIIELKNLMDNQYRQEWRKIIVTRFSKDKNVRENLNLGEEIFYTLFYNPIRYRRRINLDKLIDDIFFSDLSDFERKDNIGHVKPLLKDLSKLMGFLRGDEDNWFFDF